MHKKEDIHLIFLIAHYATITTAYYRVALTAYDEIDSQYPEHISRPGQTLYKYNGYLLSRSMRRLFLMQGI